MIWLLIFFISISPLLSAQDYKSLKILHMSLHAGCIKDFEEVGKELDLDLISWYIHKSPEQFEGFRAENNNIYNIGPERAARVWQKNKDYFEQFDVIVTSDTAPLSRIFLQNNWQKPLIIWVCNRFDYANLGHQDEQFPDKEYYELFSKATTMPNVKIISYTPYEHYYAKTIHGIDIGTRTIKPIGIAEQPLSADFVSAIPAEINKEETLFLFPRMNEIQLKWIQNLCKIIRVDTYTCIYNGPEDLKGFKGVLFFPYAWSNIALFENIQRGIIHFVPSEHFIKDLYRQRAPIRFFSIEDLHLCEWYCEEYRDLFIYFHSWDDLAKKVRRLENAEELRKKIKEFGKQHRAKMLAAWEQVFKECAEYKEQNVQIH
jgi:hypothetical protein